MAANFAISNSEGIDFTATYTAYSASSAISSTNDPAYPAPPFVVGTHAEGNNGTEYVFVSATSALTQYQCVGINPTTWAAAPITLAMVVAQSVDIGITQVTCAASSYCWVALRGQNLKVLTKLGSLANAKLYPSTSAGTLTSTSVHTSGPITGLILTQSTTSARLVGGSSPGTACYGSWPRALV